MAVRFIRFLIILTSLILCANALRAQNEVVHIYGQLRDDVNKKKLDGCKVTVFKDGSQADLIDTGTSGKYDLTLKLGHTYDIKFSKEGFLPKILRLDTRNIPEEERYGGFDMNVPGTLFADREGFNTDLLKEPIAIAKYFPNEDALKFDEDYSAKKVAMIAAEHKRLDDLAKNYEKLKKQFDDLMSAGDKKMAETKYGDAMDKFKSALDIFPKDETAKAKYNDAKARMDAENANKEFEARYAQLLVDAKKLFDASNYEEAKKKYQEASKMKDKEKIPKEGIWECDQALKNQAQRKEYDAIVADADKKFNNKDYAVSIDRYKEALAILKNETYPKDQITKAELALKAMLDDEAARIAKQKEYDAKIALAAGFEKDDNLVKAISTYREAGFILPSEKLPGEKIKELEKILADRNKQNEELARKNNENELREKQYNDLIAQADDLFLTKKLTQSRAKYEEASRVKPEASWPKTRIQTIDQMLMESTANADKLRQKAIADSLAALKLASMDDLTRRKMELEKKATELAEKRRKYQEEQRQDKLNALSMHHEKLWNSQADAEAEDEVEQYYRDARAKEDAARNNEIRQRVIENNSYYVRNSMAQNEAIAQREADILAQRSAEVELTRKGEVVYTQQVLSTELKKKEGQKKQADAQQSAESRLKNNQVINQSNQKQLDDITSNDRQRKMRIANNESEKQKAKKDQEDAQRHGDVLRRDNEHAIESSFEKQRNTAYQGEQVRQEKQSEVEESIKTQQRVHADKTKSANEKIRNASSQINNQKAVVAEQAQVGNAATDGKANAIANQKEALELQKREREVAEAQKHFENYNTAHHVKSGPKEPTSSSESLAEGVTENSYKFGNKMITERKVTVGNKVITYKKVVSKTAIYYFKDGASISETTWKMETLSKK